MAAKFFLNTLKYKCRILFDNCPTPCVPIKQHHSPNFTFQRDNYPTTDTLELSFVDNKNYKKYLIRHYFLVVKKFDLNLIL